MRLLVTGGCGFIGSNFCHFMLGKYPHVRLVNVDKLTYAGNAMNTAPLADRYGDRYHFLQADIADPEAMDRAFSKHRIEAVVNFAAESHVDRSIDDAAPFITTNVQGTQVLLDCSRRHQVQTFVQVSTDEVYGTLGPEGRFTEQTPLAPNSPYSASKAAADLLVRAWVETYGLHAVITRCSNNYGPYQFPEKLIPLMITLAVKGKPLPVYGDGLHVRDWIYVEDHCRGVDLALRRGRSGAAYNFGGDAELANIDLVRTLLEQLGKPESLIRFVKDRPGHDRRYAMDFSLARQELGWEPQVSFETGLRRTIAWYLENTEWLRSVQSGAYRSFMDRWYDKEGRHG